MKYCDIGLESNRDENSNFYIHTYIHLRSRFIKILWFVVCIVKDVYSLCFPLKNTYKHIAHYLLIKGNILCQNQFICQRIVIYSLRPTQYVYLSFLVFLTQDVHFLYLEINPHLLFPYQNIQLYFSLY